MRVFKTAWFAKAARKAFISDEELCSAIKQVVDGGLQMATKGKVKSDAFEAIHSSASALYKVGAIDKATMRSFDTSCISTPPSLKLE